MELLLPLKCNLLHGLVAELSLPSLYVSPLAVFYATAATLSVNRWLSDLCLEIWLISRNTDYAFQTPLTSFPLTYPGSTLNTAHLESNFFLLPNQAAASLNFPYHLMEPSPSQSLKVINSKTQKFYLHRASWILLLSFPANAFPWFKPTSLLGKTGDSIHFHGVTNHITWMLPKPISLALTSFLNRSQALILTTCWHLHGYVLSLFQPQHIQGQTHDATAQYSLFMLLDLKTFPYQTS